jgi:hypothetical protein
MGWTRETHADDDSTTDTSPSGNHVVNKDSDHNIITTVDYRENLFTSGGVNVTRDSDGRAVSYDPVKD